MTEGSPGEIYVPTCSTRPDVDDETLAQYWYKNNRSGEYVEVSRDADDGRLKILCFCGVKYIVSNDSRGNGSFISTGFNKHRRVTCQMVSCSPCSPIGSSVSLGGLSSAAMEISTISTPSTQDQILVIPTDLVQDCFIPSGISVVTDADNNNSIFLESPESSSNLMISEEEEEKVIELVERSLKKFVFLRRATDMTGAIFLYCCCCGFNVKSKPPRMWYVNSICGNFDWNMTQHGEKVEHVNAAKTKQSQSLLSNWVSIVLRPNDYTDPVSAKKCLGYWQISIEEREMMMQLPLNMMTNFYFDMSLSTHFASTKSNGAGEPAVVVRVDGTIRSKKCMGDCHYSNECYDNFACFRCAVVATSKDFLRLKERRFARLNGKMQTLPFGYDFHDTLVSRCQALSCKVQDVQLKNLNLKKSLERSKKGDMFKTLKEDEKNGDLVNVLKTLTKAKLDGSMSSDDTIWKYILCTMTNWYKSSRGARYPVAIFEMLQAVQIKGGAAVADLVSRCLNLGSSSSRRRFIRQHSIEFQVGVCDGNFSIISDIYIKLIEAIVENTITEATSSNSSDIEPSQTLRCGYIIGQDESPCIKNISLKLMRSLNHRGEQCDLSVVGFCGYKTGKGPIENNAHNCFQGPHVLGVNSVADIEYYFQNCEIAGAVSAIMVIPWCKNLKPFPVALVPTCLRFNQEQIKDIWSSVEEKCASTVGKYFKCEPSGWASDGCSVRVPRQWYIMSKVDKRGHQILANIPAGHNIFTLSHVCIGLRGYIHEQSGNVIGIHLQDCFHVIKNAVCVMLSAIRDLKINHRVSVDLILQAVFQNATLGNIQDFTFEFAKNGLLTKAEIEYKDRMNVLIAQRYISVRIQIVLDELLQQPGGDKFISTKEYIRVLCHFRMMFYAVNTPFRERIKYCGHVITFMFGWYHWVKESKENSLKKIFITMQTFRHMMLSTNSWLLTFMAAREYFPDEEISKHLDCSRLGSNDCELLFSMLSGFGSIEAGKRDGNVMELERLMGCHLTMYQNSGDRSKGQVPLARRKREYDPDQRSMISDEKLLGFECKQIESFSTFTDAYIHELLDEGVALGLEALERCGAHTNKKNHLSLFFNYSILAFQKHLVVNPRRGPGAMQHDGSDDDNSDADADGEDDDDDDDDDDDVHSAYSLGDTRVDSRRHYVITEQNETPTVTPTIAPNESMISYAGPPISQITILEQIIDPDGDAADIGSLLQEAEEHEAVNHIEEIFIQTELGDSLVVTNKQQYFIVDDDGSMIDARPLLAAMNKNIYLKCDSKNRVDKVKCLMKAKESDVQVDDDNNVQSFTLGSFGAFCFEDPTVSGGYRFWIGQIDKILRVANGTRARIYSRVELTAKNQTDMLLCCSWLQPMLPRGSSNDAVLTASDYIYCGTEENKDFISAEYLVYIVTMNNSHHNDYRVIDPVHLESVRFIVAAKAAEEELEIDLDEDTALVGGKATASSTSKRKRKASEQLQSLAVVDRMDTAQAVVTNNVTRFGRTTGTKHYDSLYSRI